MKKFLVIGLAALALIAAGCTAPKQTAAPTATPTVAPVESLAATTSAATATPAAEATPAPTESAAATASPAEIEPLSLQDLMVVVDGEYYDLQSDVGSLLETIGEGFDVEDVKKGPLSGSAEKQYVYPNIVISTYGADDIDVMYSVEIKDDAFDTARSIHPGSTADEVKAAYGTGFYEDNGAMVYTFDGKKADNKKSSLTFKMKDGVVSALIIYNAGEIQQ